MDKIKELFSGILLCVLIAIPAWFLGKLVPIIGAAVFAILIGIIVASVAKKYPHVRPGVMFTSKKVLQYAVILLGFGMNLSVVAQTGLRSLPIILSTITISLVVAYIFYKIFHVPEKISVLVGVGSSICGGSAIAATAPVIDADNEEIAQAISVIFFFNVLAALIFPTLGMALGFSTTSGEAFGIFAGTAVNDTSSVTAAASTWDAMHQLGAATLDKAVTVKLTRTLAIIPITLVLAMIRARKSNGSKDAIQLRSIFPFFILWFIAASIITTIATTAGVSTEFFTPFKTLSKFFIVMAMGAIGVNTDLMKLIKSGGKPLLLGFCCWVSITITSLFIQKATGLW